MAIVSYPEQFCRETALGWREQALPVKAQARFFALLWPERVCLEHFNFEMLAYGKQKLAYPHFVARIFRKARAERLTQFIRKMLQSGWP